MAVVITPYKYLHVNNNDVSTLIRFCTSDSPGAAATLSICSNEVEVRVSSLPCRMSPSSSTRAYQTLTTPILTQLDMHCMQTQPTACRFVFLFLAHAINMNAAHATTKTVALPTTIYIHESTPLSCLASSADDCEGWAQMLIMMSHLQHENRRGGVLSNRQTGDVLNATEARIVYIDAIIIDHTAPITCVHSRTDYELSCCLRFRCCVLDFACCIWTV